MSVYLFYNCSSCLLCYNGTNESDLFIGIDFKLKTLNVDGKRLRMQIWYVLLYTLRHSVYSVLLPSAV